MTRIGPESDLPQGIVVGHEGWAVGNNGAPFAVSRRCRHLRADLAGGSIDADGCLVCPWHQATYDVATGRMLRGPQGIFARIPGFGTVVKTLTAVLPLRRGRVESRNGDLYVTS